MSWELLTVAVMTGVANWAFRALPVIARADRIAAGGWLERFLSATGPAAIGTLFVASILPALVPEVAKLLPLATGTTAVLATWYARRSVVLATLVGAMVHGMTVWLML